MGCRREVKQGLEIHQIADVHGWFVGQVVIGWIEVDDGYLAPGGLTVLLQTMTVGCLATAWGAND